VGNVVILYLKEKVSLKEKLQEGHLVNELNLLMGNYPQETEKSYHSCVFFFSEFLFILNIIRFIKEGYGEINEKILYGY